MASDTVSTQRRLVTSLLMAMPIAVLLVPQGVQEGRTWVLETIFVTVCLLGAFFVILRWQLMQRVAQVRYANALLLICLAYLVVINPMWSLLRGNSPGTIATTVLPFALLGLYYVFALHRMNERETRSMIGALAVSGLLLGAVVILNFFFGDLTDYDMRSAQIEGDRNLALPLLAMAGVLSLAYALVLRTSILALLSFISTGVIVVAILMTVTRGLLIAFVIGAGATFVLLLASTRKATRLRILGRTFLGVAVLAALALPFAAQWLERLDPADEQDLVTITGRLDEYAAFFNAFLTSPVIGVGMGQIIVDPSSFVYPLGFEGIARCHSHLFFFLATTGIVGLCLYYALTGAAFVKLWKQCRRATGHVSEQAAAAGLFGAGVAGFVYTMSTTMFNTLSYNIFWAVILYTAWNPVLPHRPPPRDDARS